MRTLNRLQRIALVVLGILIALLLTTKLRYSGTAPVKLEAANCDSDLWKHVYEKDRLKVLEPCTAVEGRVLSVHRNSDGDLHVALDPENKSVLNLINVTHAHRTLVVEIVCDHPPKSAESGAEVACRDFHPQVTIPNVGDRVRVTGTYVTDRDNGWNEVHPVTRIEILH